MKFANETWFHMIVLVSISFAGFLVANLIAEMFGIKDRILVAILTGIFTGPAAGLYFTKRVERK